MAIREVESRGEKARVKGLVGGGGGGGPHPVGQEEVGRG